MKPYVRVLALAAGTFVQLASALAQQPVQVPHRFSSGSAARASEVNDNFDALAAGINANAAAIRSLPPQQSLDAADAPSSIAVVAAIGGHYATPLEAIENATAGDAWCRPSNADPAATPCVISIAPGLYDVPETLVVPPFVSVIGHGPKSTVLRALQGVQVTVQLGEPPAESATNLGISLRDLAVENTLGMQSTSVALELPTSAGIEVLNVRAVAVASNQGIAVRIVGRGDQPLNRIEGLDASASGGTASAGLQIVSSSSHNRVDGCSIAASGDGTNIGVDNFGLTTLAQCEISATGGNTAIAVRAAGENTVANTAIQISDSRLRAHDATNVNTGFRGRYVRRVMFRDVELEAIGSGENTGIWLSLIPPFREGEFDGVRAEARGGTSSAGMYNEAGHDETVSLTVVRSSLAGVAFGGTGTGYGVRLSQGSEGRRLSVVSSSVSGSTASMYYSGQPRDGLDYGPPLTVYIADTRLGRLSMSGHFVKCVAVSDVSGFYPDTCPPGSAYTPAPL